VYFKRFGRIALPQRVHPSTSYRLSEDNSIHHALLAVSGHMTRPDDMSENG
jgi:hypothetical protein